MIAVMGRSARLNPVCPAGFDPELESFRTLLEES
jgi:hypothetical protein